VNVRTPALDSDGLPDGASPKDCTAALPSAVQHQALRDARAVWKRSCDLGVLPLLRTPIGQWHTQNGRIDGDLLLIPVAQDGQVKQIAIRCRAVDPLGKPGILRIKRTRGKWVADVASPLPEPEPATAQGPRAGRGPWPESARCRTCEWPGPAFLWQWPTATSQAPPVLRPPQTDARGQEGARRAQAPRQRDALEARGDPHARAWSRLPCPPARRGPHPHRTTRWSP
jgi:hypothetical protein